MSSHRSGRAPARLLLRPAGAAVAGLLTDLAFPPYDLWPLAILGVALLVACVRGLRPLGAWAVALVYGLAFFIPHLYFTFVAAGTPIAWLALAGAQAALLALWAPGAAFAGRAGPLARATPGGAAGRAVLVAALWVCAEHVRAVWPFSGLPWGMLAFSQTDSPLLSLAPYGSTVAVSGAVVLAGALLAEAGWALLRRDRAAPVPPERPAAPAGGSVPARSRRPGTVPALTLAALAAVVVVSPLVLPAPRPSQVGELRAAIVQGNVPTAGASWAHNARGVVRNHAELTVDLARGSEEPLDVVLWPESASDLDPRDFPDVAEVVDRAARAAGAPILLGTQRFEPSLDRPRERHNELLTWLPGQGTVDSYAKQQPVAFGEYMPMRDFFRLFTSAVDLVGTDMAAGTEPGLVRVPGAGEGGADVPLAVAICFEVANDRLVREGVELGGEVIVVPTNNASFGTSRESVQQFAMTRFRAVEHGRVAVQVSTMGVSGVVHPDGSVAWLTGLWEPAGTVLDLPRYTGTTVADRLGDLPLILAGVLAGVGVPAGLVAGRRAPRSPHPEPERHPVE